MSSKACIDSYDTQDTVLGFLIILPYLIILMVKADKGARHL